MPTSLLSSTMQMKRRILKMRGQPIWREGFVTDNGNHILDVHDLQMPNPLEMEARINRIPGVVTVGMFAHRPADVLILGSEQGPKTIKP